MDLQEKSNVVSDTESGSFERNLKLHLAIAETRRLENNLPAINRLPPEILSEIFASLQPAIPTRYSIYLLPRLFNDWTVVNGVCHHWREVSLNTPRLWDHILLRSASDPFGQMGIRLSAEVPLKIYYSPSQTCTSVHDDRFITKDVLHLINGEANRLQELHVSYDGPTKTSALGILNAPYPNLEAFSITSVNKTGSFVLRFPLLFSSFTPRLKRLSLGIFGLPLNKFGGLTHLHLYNQPPKANTLKQFLEILRSSPDLHELILVGAGPDLNVDTLVPERTLPLLYLPYLHTLEIGRWETVEGIGFFLSHIVISRTATRCIWGDAINGNLSFLLNSSVSARYSDVSRIAIIMDNKIRRAIAIKECTLYIVGEIDASHYVSLFTDISFPNARELILWPGPPRAYPGVGIPNGLGNDLRQLIAALPSLQILTLTKYSPTNFREFIAAPLEIMEDGSNIIPVPYLQTLRIYTYSQYQEPNEPVDILQISLLAKRRADIGHPIEILEVENVPEDAQLKLLNENFAHVRQVRRGQSDFDDDNLCDEVLDMIHEWPSRI